MCGAPEVIAAIFFAAGVPTLIAAAKLRARFSRLLEQRHPDVWDRFGRTGYFKHDDSPKESAVGWYLISGAYRYLNDESIDQIGGRARSASFIAVCMFILGFAAMQLPTYVSVLSCVVS